MSNVVIPSHEEVSVSAYFNWVRRGRVDGFHEQDWTFAEETRFLQHNYAVVAHHNLVDPKKTFFGSNNKPQRCRFYGGHAPERTFGNKAHTIPEMLGNKAMFSKDECDNCNSEFSKLENHLSALLAISRPLTNVRGKKSKLTFETNSRKSKLSAQNGVVRISQTDDDPICTIEDSEIVISVESPTLIPIAVYKCFTKMALSVMPEQYLPDLQDTISWVRRADHEWLSEEFSWLTSYHSFIPGPIDSKYGFVCLLKRRQNEAELPYMLFVVAFTNQAFQIMLPCCHMDNQLIGKNVAIPWFPFGRDFHPEFGPPRRAVIPLGTSTATRAELSAKTPIPESALQSIGLPSHSNEAPSK